MLVSELPPEEFVPGIELTKRETATLAAIVAFVAVQDGMAMPLFELQRAADEQRAARERGDTWDELHRLDASAPGRLARLGLVELLGSRLDRWFVPTAAGLARLQQ